MPAFMRRMITPFRFASRCVRLNILSFVNPFMALWYADAIFGSTKSFFQTILSSNQAHCAMCVPKQVAFIEMEHNMAWSFGTEECMPFISQFRLGGVRYFAVSNIAHGQVIVFFFLLKRT